MLTPDRGYFHDSGFFLGQRFSHGSLVNIANIIAKMFSNIYNS